MTNRVTQGIVKPFTNFYQSSRLEKASTILKAVATGVAGGILAEKSLQLARSQSKLISAGIGLAAFFYFIKPQSNKNPFSQENLQNLLEQVMEEYEPLTPVPSSNPEENPLSLSPPNVSPIHSEEKSSEDTEGEILEDQANFEENPTSLTFINIPPINSERKSPEDTEVQILEDGGYEEFMVFCGSRLEEMVNETDAEKIMAKAKQSIKDSEEKIAAYNPLVVDSFRKLRKYREGTEKYNEACFIYNHYKTHLEEVTEHKKTLETQLQEVSKNFETLKKAEAQLVSSSKKKKKKKSKTNKNSPSQLNNI